MLQLDKLLVLLLKQFTANGPIWQHCAYGLNIKGAPEMTWSLGLQYAVNDAITIDLQGYGADETDSNTETLLMLVLYI